MFWTLQAWQLVILFYFLFIWLPFSCKKFIIFNHDIQLTAEWWRKLALKISIIFSEFIGRFFQQLKRKWTIASAIWFDFGYNNNRKIIWRNTVVQLSNSLTSIRLLGNPKTIYGIISLKYLIVYCHHEKQWTFNEVLMYEVQM